MKTLARLLGAVTASVIVTLLIGCNTASQKFSTVTTAPDGTKTERTSKGSIWNVIQAKQSVADFHGQNGEVQAFGTGAATQEAQTVEVVKAAGGLALDAFRIYSGAGLPANTSAGTVANITAALTGVTNLISALPTTSGFDTYGNLRVNVPGAEWYMLIGSNRTLQICFPDGRCYGILPNTK